MLRRLLAAFAGIAALGLCAATNAPAADSLYWSNLGSNSLSFAALDATNAGNLTTTGVTVNKPYGVAIDSPSGRIFWTNSATNKIAFADLSGGGGGTLVTNGATKKNPIGIAIDQDRVYWANYLANKISYANLDGSGGGDLSTAGASMGGPFGVAIDPEAGRIYWANFYATNTISYANLDGSGGGGNLTTTGATTIKPAGLAIDPSAGRIYWGNDNGASSKISFANLNGSGGADLDTTGATVHKPIGLAIDPAAGRVYWVNQDVNKVSFANLNGTGGGDIPTLAATVNQPDFILLQKAPVGTGVPTIQGGPAPDSTLFCSQGKWADDLYGSFLFRAPESISYQWSRDGVDIGGKTAGALRPGSVGEYRCRVTAQNQAGSTPQTSAPVAVFEVGKAKPDPKHGSARISVDVPVAGKLALSGKDIAGDRSNAAHAGKVMLTVKAKGKAAKALKKRGKAKVNAKVTFTPTGGEAASQTEGVKLKKR